MKRKDDRRRLIIWLASMAAIILFGAGFTIFAQSKSENYSFPISVVNQNVLLNRPASNSDGKKIQSENFSTAVQEDYPKPDFTEMEKWFEIQKYEYKILNQRLNIVVKAKADRDDRPHYFNIDFYDADGVRVISTNYITEEYVAETGQIEKIWTFTPSESQMKKVKSVVITRVVN